MSGGGLRDAAERLDIDMLASVLDDEVVFRSPASSRLVFTGRRDVLLFFRTAFSTFDQVTCRAELTDSTRTVLVLDCRFGRFRFTDAILIEFGEDGLIEVFEPHVAPWPSSTLFMVCIAAKLCRHPGVLLRALRRSRRTGSGVVARQGP